MNIHHVINVLTKNDLFLLIVPRFFTSLGSH